MPMPASQWSKPTDEEQRRIKMIDEAVVKAMNKEPGGSKDKQFTYNRDKHAKFASTGCPAIGDFTDREQKFFSDMWTACEDPWERVHWDLSTITFTRTIRMR